MPALHMLIRAGADVTLTDSEGEPALLHKRCTAVARLERRINTLHRLRNVSVRLRNLS